VPENYYVCGGTVSKSSHNSERASLTITCSWRRVKGDYLYHFSLPRLDLLAWVLITKLAPTYYQKLEVMLNDIGHFRELPKWRKDFKAVWMKAMKTPITMPMNKRYRPDIQRFVCTCLQFVVSRFLVCKHLVQQFQPVNPRFFLEVTRNRTLPFWSHPTLKPLAMAADESHETEQELADGPKATDGNSNNTGYSRLNLAAYGIDDMSDDDDDGLIDTEGRGDNTVTEKNAVKEKMENYIRIIRDFSDGLEYQLKFQDPRFLTTLEKDGAGFIRLAQNCLSRERRQNSSRAASPSTWERSTANALFYRARPSRDHGT
jgi:hypothetical protein